MDDVRAKLEWFKAVILPHEGALRARLRSMRRNADDLDDLVSEILVRAYANPRWREIEMGRAHIFTIARNFLVDQLRRERVVSFETIADLDALQGQLDLEAQLFARDKLRRLQDAVDSMPQQAAQVFLKRRIDQKSPRQIAAEMNLSLSTVEKHLSKAMRLLVRAMAEQEADSVEPGQCQRKKCDRAAGR